MKSYTCIDVLEPLNLCKKYLNIFKDDNVSFVNVENLDDLDFENKYDLVISNWCLSEFNVEGIGYYINNIIRFIDRGYFLMNIWDNDRKNFTINEFSKFFENVYIENEITKTNFNKNFLLWIKK